MLRKSQWIAKQLDEDQEDVYDVLLGNITKPRSLVDAVQAKASEYDAAIERWDRITANEGRVDSQGTLEGRFSSY